MLLERLLKSQEGQGLGLESWLVEALGRLWRLPWSCEISLFEAISDGGSDGVKSFNEPSVEGGKTMEATNFLKGLGFRPIQNGPDLFWVHGNSSGRDNIT